MPAIAPSDVLERTGTGKRFLRGTHRIRTPEETWDWLAGTLPSAGITRVADVTALDCLGVPVCQAVRPGSRNLTVSQGKGASLAAARVSAAMEAIELWHAEDLSRQPQIAMTPREMRSASAIPLASLRWSGVTVPDELVLSWVRAHSLTASRHGWLPRAMLELDFEIPLGVFPRWFDLTSNGLASGNCLEEALVHALCELIERHALHLVRREPARQVPIDLEAIGDPWAAETITRFRAAGARLAIHDVTWEVGIPAIVADLTLPDLPHVWRGSGCHPSPEVALSRALTEAAQSRLTYISGARDDLALLAGEPGDDRTFRDFAVAPATRPFAALPDVSTGDVAEDLAVVVRRLAALGVEAFFVDLTREEVGIPVVIAFVPGLREIPHE
jgi:ribosomal protein S12 methylthiotransferase accessory factor